MSDGLLRYQIKMLKAQLDEFLAAGAIATQRAIEREGEMDQLRAALAAATQRNTELETKYQIAIQQLAAANNERGVMYGEANRESDAIKRADEAESALMAALDEAHDYRLKLQDVVSGTAIAELEMQLAYYRAMVAAVPEYIESCNEDYAAGIDAPITLEQWFEDVSRQDEDE